jgi:hypothetical protein
MGSSQSRGSPPEKESVSPGSDNSSIPDIPTVVLQHEPQVQPEVEEPSVQEPPVEEPSVQEPPVEEPSVQEPSVQEPPVEEPSVQEPRVTPDAEIATSQMSAIQSSILNSPGMQGTMSDMIRDAIIKYNLPPNVKLSFKLTPVSFKINRESDNKPVSDVIEMAEANPVVVQPASETEKALETEKTSETEKVPEVIETRSEDS